MSRDFLNYPQWDTRIAHLGEGGTAEAVGADSFDPHSYTGGAQQPHRRVAVEVGIGSRVEFVAREEVAGVAAGGIGGELGAEVGDDGDGAGGEFAFGVAFADDEFGADVAPGVVDIAFGEGDGFRDPTGGVETHGKQGAVAVGLDGEALIKEQLNFGDGEDFGLTVAVDFHGNTQLGYLHSTVNRG